VTYILYKLGGGPDARRIIKGASGGPFQAPGQKRWLTRPQDPCTSLTPGSPATPALVAHAQGGITLSLEKGELDADFCKLGAFSSRRASMAS
jgi:hypothetical protein